MQLVAGMGVKGSRVSSAHWKVLGGDIEPHGPSHSGLSRGVSGPLRALRLRPQGQAVVQ